MSIKLLYEELYKHESGSQRNPQIIIDTFERNESAINEMDVNSSAENYAFIRLVTSDYACSLVLRECYTKALPFLNRSISLWENSRDIEKGALSNSRWYETLRFDRGRSYNFKKKYKEAKNDFSWLNKHFPDNDNYKVWLAHCQNGPLIRIQNFLLFSVLSFLVFVPIVIKKEHHALRLTFLSIATIGYIVFLVLRIILWLRQKKLRGN